MSTTWRRESSRKGEKQSITVDQGGAAKASARVDLESAARGIGLWDGLITPVGEHGLKERQRRSGLADQGVRTRVGARVDNGNDCCGILGEAVGEHEAACAAADDYIVEGLGS